MAEEHRWSIAVTMFVWAEILTPARRSGLHYMLAPCGAYSADHFGGWREHGASGRGEQGILPAHHAAGAVRCRDGEEVRPRRLW